MTIMTATPQLRAIDPLVIDFDPTQPRQQIDPEQQGELEVSIREQGIITPLRVVAKPNGRFQLLYGERRLRAALANELDAVPCLVADTIPTWAEALDIQLTENLHRADLRPLEVAQTLWRRILGANIAALEDEQGDDGQTTAQLLGWNLTPASQIAALEDRLCALAGVSTVTDYFGSGRVRVSRKTVLGRFGMAHHPESRLKKLFATLDVDSAVQEMLAGVDVSARTLRDLRKQEPAAQAALVEQAKAQASDTHGSVGTTLRGLLDEATDTADDDDADPAPTMLPLVADTGKAFEPDPQLALLTKEHTAPKLVTDQVEPGRGSVPPTSAVGAWNADAVLLLEGALDTARTIAADNAVLRLTNAQAARLAPLWHTLASAVQRAGIEDE